MSKEHIPTQPSDLSFQQVFDEVKELARREPAKAVAAAFGVGLLLNLLPTRILAGSVTALGAVLIRPVLLSLGVTKALELCCPNKTNPIKS